MKSSSGILTTMRLAQIAFGLTACANGARKVKREDVGVAVVACPGSTNPDVMCNRNQCCPGIMETNYMNFPCPNAQPGWNGCETTAPGGNPSPPPPPSPGPPPPPQPSPSPQP